MLPIRVSLVLAAALLLPASASADLRSPVLGETTMLSRLVPATRTYAPAIATDGNTTFVVYTEADGGVTLHRIAASGTEIGAPRELQSPGTASLDGARVVISGEDVYVAWAQAAYGTPEMHVVVAASHDGGSSFDRPVMAGRLTGEGAWDPMLAADGQNIFVGFVDAKGRMWTAGSRDGGRSFPCMAIVSPPGADADGGGDYSMAVDGDHIYWTWLSGFDIFMRRSVDGGRTLQEPVKLHAGSGASDYPGVPHMVANDGNVVVSYSKQYTLPRDDNTGTDWGFEPEVLSSQDGGNSWHATHIGDEGERCVGNYCSPPYGLAFSGDNAYLGWADSKGTMWLAASHDGGGSWGGPVNLGPYLYRYHSSSAPYVAAHGDSVVATWYTAPTADAMSDIDSVAAFSSDRGRTFNLRTIAAGEKWDVAPVAAAWGPDPQGAGFAWWSVDGSWYNGDTNVRFAPLSSAQPDVDVIDVRPLQVAKDAARLAAGRPTTVRAMLRSAAPERVSVKLHIDLSYDDAGGRVEKSVVEDVVLKPGLNPVELLADNPVTVAQGRVTAKVTVDPDTDDADPTNNVGEGSRAVVQPRPLRILFVPVAADDELPPACQDVRDVALGTEQYLKAAWPVDPARVSVVTDCSETFVHPSGLTEAGLMDVGGLIPRLDRLKYEAGADDVIGVVPQGWFSRQQIDGFAGAVGIAPMASPLDAGLVERQNTGGWVVAHELTHIVGEDHLKDEPAPGYWVTAKRDIPGTIVDYMQPAVNGADVADPTGRWISQKTWDFLTTKLSTGVITGLAAADSLTLSGSVAKDGSVKTDPLWQRDGAPESGDGAYTAELVDAGGTVLDTRRFGAVNDLATLGGGHIVTDHAAFSVRLPDLAAARKLRVSKDGSALFTRTRSAQAPAVKVDTPGKIAIGDDLKLSWTATDADGDALTSAVSISLDGGATWRPLGEPTSAKALTVKAILQLAGGDVRVRVTTTDGWNTTTSDSGSFAIGGTLTDGRIVVDNNGGGVYTASLDGASLTKLDAHGLRPRWSLDGTKLVWDDMANLWTAKADGSAIRRVTDVPAGGQYLWPLWSPDGDQIIAERRTNFVHDANLRVNPETSAETPFAAANGTLCGFSRDGSRLLAQYGTYGDAYSLFHADGTAPVEYKRPISGQDCMALSPDQRYGVVARYDNYPQSMLDIVVWDLQTGAETNLTKGQFGGYNVYPTWSPTGDWIVWASNKDRGGDTGFSATDIWKMHPDGTGAVKVIDGASGSFAFERPDVQPLRGLAADPEPTLADLSPSASADDMDGVEGTPVTLHATAKPGVEGAAIASTTWDVDGDGVYGDDPHATFPDEGSYTVSVLVTDARGRSTTATADVKIVNADPVISAAKVSDAGTFSARVSDPGAGDVLAAVVNGKAVPLIAAGDGAYTVLANVSGAHLVVSDGDGGVASADAAHVTAPVPPAPTAADAGATVAAGESVDIALPASGEVTVVSQPQHGSVQLRAASLDPGAADVTYVADNVVGSDSFTYKVTDTAGESRVATVSVNVTARPDAPIVAPTVPELPTRRR